MIEFDAFTESNGSGSDGGTEPFIHVSNCGANGLLLVGVYVDSLADGVTTVTYGGVELTNLSTVSVSAGKLWVGYLKQPPVGSYNVDIFFSGSVPKFRGGAITFANVNPIDPLGGENEASWEDDITGSTRSTTVTVEGTKGMVVDFFYVTRADTGNATSPQIEKMNNTGVWGASGVNHLAGISYIAHTGSDVTMEWENLTYGSSAADQMIYAVELLPSTFVPRITII